MLTLVGYATNFKEKSFELSEWPKRSKRGISGNKIDVPHDDKSVQGSIAASGKGSNLQFGSSKPRSKEAATSAVHKRVMNVFAAMQIDEEEVRVKHRVHKLLDGSKVQLFLLVVTFYALFADDYRYLTTDKDYDTFYDVFIIICMTIFGLEILLSSIYKPGYFNSYYFWLDAISTASLILDFSPIKIQIILYR